MCIYVYVMWYKMINVFHDEMYWRNTILHDFLFYSPLVTVDVGGIGGLGGDYGSAGQAAYRGSSNNTSDAGLDGLSGRCALPHTPSSSSTYSPTFMYLCFFYPFSSIFV